MAGWAAINTCLLFQRTDGQYAEDPRATDNAWVETSVQLFHDATGHGIGRFALDSRANTAVASGDDDDDAAAVATTAGQGPARARWTMAHADITLFSSHKEFVRRAAEQLGAYW